MKKIEFNRFIIKLNNRYIITIPIKYKNELNLGKIVKINIDPFFKEFIKINDNFKPIVFYDKIKSLTKDNKRLYFSIPAIITNLYKFEKGLIVKVNITIFDKKEVVDIIMNKGGMPI